LEYTLTSSEQQITFYLTPVKGMLIGQIIIFNWSFVPEDIRPLEITKQIALALNKEVQHLEKNRVHKIQVDEPALREGLTLKKEKQTKYLSDAVYALKLSTTAIKKRPGQIVYP
jgi:5-methyltetrahydropteroyltriglutamate--homocysteine methyltransferase